ncbi:unnamed protein product [Brassica oleracea]
MGGQKRTTRWRIHGSGYASTGFSVLIIQKLTTKQLTKLIPENPGCFKSLIKIPPAQAVELLYFSDSPSSSSQAAADGSDIDASLCVFDGLAIELHKRLESFRLEPKVVLSISQTELCRA